MIAVSTASHGDSSRQMSVRRPVKAKNSGRKSATVSGSIRATQTTTTVCRRKVKIGVVVTECQVVQRRAACRYY
jgi:hypothetical protein